MPVSQMPISKMPSAKCLSVKCLSAKRLQLNACHSKACQPYAFQLNVCKSNASKFLSAKCLSVKCPKTKRLQLNVWQSNACRQNDFRPKDAKARFEQNGENFQNDSKFKTFFLRYFTKWLLVTSRSCLYLRIIYKYPKTLRLFTSVLTKCTNTHYQ